MTFKPSLTEQELNSLYQMWLAANGDGRDRHDLRFGQWLCNTYLLPEGRFPNLFYAEKASEAYTLAYNEIQLISNHD